MSLIDDAKEAGDDEEQKDHEMEFSNDKEEDG